MTKKSEIPFVLAKRFIMTAVTILISFSLYAQSKNSVDVWKIVVKIIHKTTGASNVSINTVIDSFSYYINNDLVLRRDSLIERPFKKSKKSTSRNGKTVNTTMTARFVNPVYLIDLKSGLTYTYCRDSLSYYIAIDSLKNYLYDIVYRFKWDDSLRGKVQSIKEMKEDQQSVAGYKTYAVSASTISSHSIYYRMSESKLPFSSPLNAFYPETTHDILEMRAPMTSIKNTENCLVITEAKKITVSKKFFQLHRQFITRRSVPYAKMLRNLVDPF